MESKISRLWRLPPSKSPDSELPRWRRPLGPSPQTPFLWSGRFIRITTFLILMIYNRSLVIPIILPEHRCHPTPSTHHLCLPFRILSTLLLRIRWINILNILNLPILKSLNNQTPHHLPPLAGCPPSRCSPPRSPSLFRNLAKSAINFKNNSF